MTLAAGGCSDKRKDANHRGNADCDEVYRSSGSSMLFQPEPISPDRPDREAGHSVASLAGNVRNNDAALLDEISDYPKLATQLEPVQTAQSSAAASGPIIVTCAP